MLCERYRWIAIMDDFDGRGAAHDRRAMSCVYMCTALIAAAAIELTGLTAEQGWEIHHAVESKRKRPRVQNKQVFLTLVRIFRAAWKQAGRPDRPQFLAAPRLDQLIDRADPIR